MMEPKHVRSVLVASIEKQEDFGDGRVYWR